MSIRRFRPLLAAVALALAPGAALLAQGTGQVAGRVLDQATGRPLPAARVAVQGTTPQVAATAGVDGRYTLTRVPAGERTLTVVLLGYAPKTVTGVRVAAGAATALDVTLSPQGIALEGLTVTATRERGSVSRALDEQRTATGIVNSTTTEQIERSPDSDAAAAVQRVSGVTVQDGRYVFVRGLGERYTTASLNGARIPSPEPEKKQVPLDLFPSGLLESISTSKTFTPDQPGDFSGASVNLRTRSFPARRTFSLSLGTGSVLGGGDALLFPGAGSNWLADDAGGRGIPPIVRAAGNFGGLNQGDVNLIARSFGSRFSPDEDGLPPNFSGSMTLGGESRIPLVGQRLGYVGSFTYSKSQDVRFDEERALAVPGEDLRAVEQNAFRGETGSTGVLWGGMLNLSTFVGTGTKIELNNSYNRASDSEAHLDWGRLEEFAQIDSVRRTSLRYVERTVRSNQLRGTHSLFGDGSLEWSVANSRVTRDEPDRTDLLYGRETDVVNGGLFPLAWLGFIPAGARHTYATLDESSWDSQGGLAFSVGPASREGRIKIGGAYRHTHRDADAASYNLRSLRLSPAQRALPPEELFDGRYTQGSDSLLTVERNTAGGFYQATDRVAAGFLMGEWLFGERVKVIGGARVERWMLDLDAEPTTGGLVNVERKKTDVLPALAVNVRLTDAQNLRVSATQTLARPEYRELAPVPYNNLVGERSEFGNPNLQRTLVQNFDARWELYPNASEVLSVGFFAKRFEAPIERIEVAASGASLISFANAESAENYGVELEVRKELGSWVPALERFSFFTNATVMRSRIHLGADSLSSATNPDRPMVGQAPYVLNAGLTYAGGDDASTSATLLYNVVGKRIYAAAQTPLRDDSYEMPRHGLDLSLRFPLLRGMSAKVDAENLFDSPVEVKQGDVTRLRYRTGRTIGIGLSWKP